MNARAFAMTAMSGALLAGVGLASTRTVSYPVHLQGTFGERRVFTVSVNTPGWLTATYNRQSGPALALILNGPGRCGRVDRQDGFGDLTVRHFVSAQDLAGGAEWRFSVASFNRRFAHASGTLCITYPVVAPRPPFPRPRPMPPVPAARDTHTFKVKETLLRGAFEEKRLAVKVPGRVTISWQPERGAGDIQVRVRQQHLARYIASGSGRGSFDLSFDVSPAMIAQDKDLIIEVVNRNGETRWIKGRVVANKPVPR